MTRKRDRPLIDIGLLPLAGANEQPTAATNASPRILPPPPSWLTSSGLKYTGKTIHQIGKRGITDWKSVGTTATAVPTSNSSNLSTNSAEKSTTAPPDSSFGVNGTLNNEFLLPNCPGATASPYKSNVGSNRKKLSPMISSDNNQQYQMNHVASPV